MAGEQRIEPFSVDGSPRPVNEEAALKPVNEAVTRLLFAVQKGSDKKHTRMILRYDAQTDIKNHAGLTAASIMTQKKDPDFRQMLESEK